MEPSEARARLDPPAGEVLSYALDIVRSPWRRSTTDRLSREHDVTAQGGSELWVAMDHESGYHWFLWAGLPSTEVTVGFRVLRTGFEEAFGPPYDEVQYPDGGHTDAWHVRGLIIELYLYASGPHAGSDQPSISPLVQLGITQSTGP